MSFIAAWYVVTCPRLLNDLLYVGLCPAFMHPQALLWGKQGLVSIACTCVKFS